MHGLLISGSKVRVLKGALCKSIKRNGLRHCDIARFSFFMHPVSGFSVFSYVFIRMACRTVRIGVHSERHPSLSSPSSTRAITLLIVGGWSGISGASALNRPISPAWSFRRCHRSNKKPHAMTCGSEGLKSTKVVINFRLSRSFKCSVLLFRFVKDKSQQDCYAPSVALWHSFWFTLLSCLLYAGRTTRTPAILVRTAPRCPVLERLG